LATAVGLIPSSFVFIYAGAVGNSMASGEAGGWSDYITYAVGLLATVAVTVKVVRVAQEALDNAVEGEVADSTQMQAPRRSPRLMKKDTTA